MRQSGAAVAAALALCVAAPVRAADESGIRQAFVRCRAIEDERDRVRCYDKLANLLAPPRFQGRLTAQTDPFEVTAPTVLRYESDGPIFVMYLKDDKNAVVQNLHIGGGGTATYTIEKPGTYSLQISGSESWRVWLDPTS